MTGLKQTILVLALMLLPSGPVAAGLSRNALSEVHLAPPQGATLPLDLTLHDRSGRTVTLKDAIGRKPALLLPVDYQCKTTCGPAVAIIAAALSDSGLRAGTDYRLILFGLNPTDDAAIAAHFAESRIGDDALLQASELLTGEAASLTRLTEAIGYSFAYDEENAAFAHPAALVAVTGEGRVTRALSSLALRPTDLRLALLEAGEGKIGGVLGQLTLMCYGFDAAHGIYTASVTRVLQIGAVATVLAAAVMIALLSWQTRRRGET
jgi:protein SCO1/2